MSLLDKYNIEDPNLREIVKELEAMVSSGNSVQETSQPLSPNTINDIGQDQIKIKSGKLYYRSGNKLYSITGNEES